MKNNKVAIIIFIFFIACKHTSVDNNIKGNEVVILPKNIELYNLFLTKAELRNWNNKKYRLYTLINVSCSTCLLQLEKWDSLQNEINERHKSVAIIPICYSKDKFELLKYLFENDRIKRINLPLFLDLSNTFETDNVGLIKHPGEFAVLTDSLNKVIRYANPLENKNEKEIFWSSIE